MNNPGQAQNSQEEPEQEKVADAVKSSWVYRLLPQSAWPYAQLARWERPIGWWLLMWPGWWSIMLAYAHFFQNSRPGTQDFWWKIIVLFTSLAGNVVWVLLLFMLGAIIMRGAGCTYNDLADQNIDDKVERTRSRPLPSGRVSRKQAFAFLGIQLMIGLIILLQFNQFTIALGFASLVTIAVYPFMKRITWWPQLFLGFAFSWGALLGWAAILGELGPAPILLYLGSILWVIGYDTIYAHQDTEDDALVGVKSTARLFGDNTRLAITLLYSGAILLFAAATFYTLPAFGIAFPAYVGIFTGGLHMVWQIRNLDIANPDHCLKLFKSNSHFGWVLFAGFSISFVLSAVQ